MPLTSPESPIGVGVPLFPPAPECLLVSITFGLLSLPAIFGGSPCKVIGLSWTELLRYGRLEVLLIC